MSHVQTLKNRWEKRCAEPVCSSNPPLPTRQPPPLALAAQRADYMDPSADTRDPGQLQAADEGTMDQTCTDVNVETTRDDQLDYDKCESGESSEGESSDDSVDDADFTMKHRITNLDTDPPMDSAMIRRTGIDAIKKAETRVYAAGAPTVADTTSVDWVDSDSDLSSDGDEGDLALFYVEENEGDEGEYDYSEDFDSADEMHGMPVGLSVASSSSLPTMKPANMKRSSTMGKRNIDAMMTQDPGLHSLISQIVQAPAEESKEGFVGMNQKTMNQQPTRFQRAQNELTEPISIKKGIMVFRILFQRPSGDITASVLQCSDKFTVADLQKKVAFKQKLQSSIEEGYAAEQDEEMLDLYHNKSRYGNQQEGQWLLPTSLLTDCAFDQATGPDGVLPLLVYAKRTMSLCISVIGHPGCPLLVPKKIEFEADTASSGAEVVKRVTQLLGLQSASVGLFGLQMPYPNTRWVEAGQPLFESISFSQPGQVNLFLRACFLIERVVGLSVLDPLAFRLIFAQAAHLVIRGRFHASMDHAALFGALLINTTNGPYSQFIKMARANAKNKRRIQKTLAKLYGKVIEEVVAPQWHGESKTMVKKLHMAHASLNNCSKIMAMLAFLNLMAFGSVITAQQRPGVPNAKGQQAGGTDKNKERRHEGYAKDMEAQVVAEWEKQGIFGNNLGPQQQIKVSAEFPVDARHRLRPRSRRQDKTPWVVQRFLVLGKAKFGGLITRVAEINIKHDMLEVFKINKRRKELQQRIYAVELLGLEKSPDDPTLLKVTSKKQGLQSFSLRDANEREKFYAGLCRIASNAADWANRSEDNMMTLTESTDGHSLSLSWAKVKRTRRRRALGDTKVTNPEPSKAQRISEVHSPEDGGLEAGREDKEFLAEGELEIQVFAATLNMAKKHPLELVKASWVPLHCDIYAIGVQECNYKPGKPHPECESHWVEMMLTRVGPGDYSVVAVHSMWEIKLLVLIRNDLKPFINNVESSHVATGFGNVGKNKGGVGISFSLFDTKMCFINMHLAARPSLKRNQLRNKNAFEILGNLQLGDKNLDTLNKFHVIWVLGDFNYRVAGIPREEVLDLVKRTRYDVLLQNDQLKQQNGMGRTLYSLVEAPISWGPSYRYMRDSDEWSDKKLFNLPSYTDRVMSRAQPGVSLRQQCYTMKRGVYGSDHRPVYGIFRLGVREPLPAPLELGPSFFPRVIVRLYGLVIDLYATTPDPALEKAKELKRQIKSKEKKTTLDLAKERAKKAEKLRLKDAAADAKGTLRNVSLRSKFLMEPVLVQGDYIPWTPENAAHNGWDSLFTPLVEMPTRHRVTGRFIANEVVTCSLGNMYPQDVARQFLTLTAAKDGWTGPDEGHGIIGLRGATGASGRCDPLPFSGHLTVNGIPIGGFSGSVVALWQ